MPLYAIESLYPTVPDDDDFWLAPDAAVIGDVRLAKGVSIWFGAVVRADNDSISIGAGSNIQDNCVLHADPDFPIRIAQYCTVGHNAIVHGCSIGENTLIGMGSTILNGARVGRNCLIGANALVSENVAIPDNSMVRGIPGKVVGVIDEERARLLRSTAEKYMENARRYQAGLVPVGVSSRPYKGL